MNFPNKVFSPRASQGVPATSAATASSQSSYGRPMVRPYIFSRLEKVRRNQVELLRRLNWILPEGLFGGEMNEPIKQALRRIFDQEITCSFDHVYCVAPENLLAVVGDPTFLALIAPAPRGARGIIELDLALAHGMIGHLLGASGESALVRPPTEIEQGVLSFILICLFKALWAASNDPSLQPLRLVRALDSVDDGLRIFSNETLAAVIELKIGIGAEVAGGLRMILPGSVASAAVPPPRSAQRKKRREDRLKKNIHRLSAVRVPLAVQIGRVELVARDVAALGAGDVMLIDSLSARVDRGEPGKARLAIGAARAGHIESNISIDRSKGTYHAQITAVISGEEPVMQLGPTESSGSETSSGNAENSAAAPNYMKNGESTVTPKTEEPTQPNAGELLDDVPLQVVVELARVPITAEEVVGLHVGKIIDLGRPPGDPVDLSVNGKIIARGALVEIEGQLGVRIGAMSE